MCIGNHIKFAVITGGLGYIGSNLSFLLEKNGWEVILLVRGDKSRDTKSFVNHFSLVEYDGTLDSLSAFNSLDQNNTVFIHLAASMAISDEIEKTTDLIDSNIRLGMDVATYMAQHGFKWLISTESYWQFDAQGLLGGNTLYATTKSAFSLLLEYMAKQYITVISLVLYDVYGPMDARGKLINNLIDSSTNNQTFDMTDGKQIIDFVHVDDVINAYLSAAYQLMAEDMQLSFHRYTVRSMRHLQLREYVSLIEQIIGKPLSIRWGRREYPKYQIMQPWLPGSDRQLPGWEPMISFEDGIRGIANFV